MIRQSSVRVDPNPMRWSGNYRRFVNCPTPWWVGPQLWVIPSSTAEKNSRRKMAAAIHLPWAFSRRACKLRACGSISALSGSLLTNLYWFDLGPVRKVRLTERSSGYLRDIKMLLSSSTKFETIYSKIKKAQNDATKTFSWGWGHGSYQIYRRAKNPLIFYVIGKLSTYLSIHGLQ